MFETVSSADSMTILMDSRGIPFQVCDICRKTVDRFEVEENARELRLEFVAYCHGESERVSIPVLWMFANYPRISEAVAFRRPVEAVNDEKDTKHADVRASLPVG